MPVNFAERLKQAEDAGLVGGGDYLKLKEGPNRLRLMTECIPHAGKFKGETNFKWLCYVIDRRDGKVKPFFMANVVYKQIVALQLSEDYAFSDVPMPYDVTIHATNAGTKEVKYSLMPAKKETPVTALEHQQLGEMKSLSDFQTALFEKQGKAPVDDAPAHGDEDQ